MNPDFPTARMLIVAAVKANPAISATDSAIAARLADPGSDCAFEELGFDSLARMELSIWLQVEAGIELSEEEVLAHPTVNALARHLSGRTE